MSAAPPTPSDTDADAFVAALRRLKAWSDLSYRQLERRAAAAGHALPYSTAATMLGRNRLPREELVVAFVAACGVRGEAAEAWTQARSTIACGQVDDATPPPTPEPAPRTRRFRRPTVTFLTAGGRRRWALAGAAALITGLLAGAAALGAFTDVQNVEQTQPSTSSPTPAPGS